MPRRWSSIQRSQKSGRPSRGDLTMYSAGQRGRANGCTMRVSCIGNAVSPTCERADALYRVLNAHQMKLVQQAVNHWQARQTIKEEKAAADAVIEEYQQRQW